MMSESTPPVELAPGQEVVLLRWGVGDIEEADDGSTVILMSGPDREPYALELDPGQVAVLRRALADSGGEESRLALLRAAVESEGGRWTTRRVIQFYQSEGLPPVRSAARHDLARLSGCGVLVRHDQRGRTTYLPPGGAP